VIVPAPPYDPQHFVRVKETITLTLKNLRPHSLATVSFDLYVLKSWDGNNPNSGPPRDHNQVRYMLGTLQVEALAKAVERYKEDCGEYPDVRDGFNGLILDPGVEGWRGPYLKEVPLDPWHRPYVYLRSADSTPEILSYGADRKPGGEFFDADISSRNMRHSMPHSPFEIRARRLLIGIWIGAWFCLIGSLLVLRRTSRRHRG